MLPQPGDLKDSLLSLPWFFQQSLSPIVFGGTCLSFLSSFISKDSVCNVKNNFYRTHCCLPQISDICRIRVWIIWPREQVSVSIKPYHAAAANPAFWFVRGLQGRLRIAAWTNSHSLSVIAFMKCRCFQSDSEYMAGQLSAYGFKLLDAPEHADIWLVNT